jgi:hypothetical protein
MSQSFASTLSPTYSAEQHDFNETQRFHARYAPIHTCIVFFNLKLCTIDPWIPSLVPIIVVSIVYYVHAVLPLESE